MYDAMTADNMTYMCLKIDISISVFVSLLRGRVDEARRDRARPPLRPPAAGGVRAPRRATARGRANIWQGCDARFRHEEALRAGLMKR